MKKVRDFQVVPLAPEGAPSSYPTVVVHLPDGVTGTVLVTEYESREDWHPLAKIELTARILHFRIVRFAEWLKSTYGKEEILASVRRIRAAQALYPRKDRYVFEDEMARGKAVHEAIDARVSAILRKLTPLFDEIDFEWVPAERGEGARGASTKDKLSIVLIVSTSWGPLPLSKKFGNSSLGDVEGGDIDFADPDFLERVWGARGGIPRAAAQLVARLVGRSERWVRQLLRSKPLKKMPKLPRNSRNPT